MKSETRLSPTTMTIAIIGDVHGCLEPLQALVEKLSLGASDQLIFVGDIVDKGPQPAETVRYIRSLHETAPFKISIVEGNHEDKHRRYHRNKLARPLTAAGMAATSSELRDLDGALSRSDRAFLSSAVPFLRIPEWNVLVVHGGIPGDMSAFPSEEEAAGLTGKKRSSFLKILRTRYLSRATGKFLAYGTEMPGDPFWAETYDGRFGHVVFGHQPFPGAPGCFSHATGVDTGAVHGFTLTALVLAAERAPRFESVPGIEAKPFKEGRGPVHPGNDLRLKRTEQP
ncbi:MAG: metallophosphoesterase [Pseudomonadota bacterium]